MNKLTVGQLAKQAGVSAVAIRHYERSGLLPKPARSEHGYRLYTKETLKRVRFITNAKEAGFSLKEILELLNIQENAKASSKNIKQCVLEKSRAVRKKIKILEEIAEALECLANSCDGKVPLSQCPILETLYSEANKKGKQS